MFSASYKIFELYNLKNLNIFSNVFLIQAKNDKNNRLVNLGNYK